MEPRDRLIVALDASERDTILRNVDELRDAAGAFKIGLQAFIANGPSLVRDLTGDGVRVFLDLKIHDIPNTAAHAVAEAAALGVLFTTVHASGGLTMLRACAGHSVHVLGVTVLTSLDDSELAAVGVDRTPLDHAVLLARLTQAAGLSGVIASPNEIEAIRGATGEGFLIITPGIRPAGTARDDQRRTMTAHDAVRAGADYVVVGRPIMAAPDRREAAERLAAEIARALG